MTRGKKSEFLVIYIIVTKMIFRPSSLFSVDNFFRYAKNFFLVSSKNQRVVGSVPDYHDKKTGSEEPVFI
ncbi:hypothetical protein NGY2020029_15660 [Vibrio cholerae]|nr:hypothetical protein VNVC001_08190 [Vibrio cholerae]